MKRIIASFFLIAAMNVTAQNEKIALWGNEVPNQKKSSEKESCKKNS